MLAGDENKQNFVPDSVARNTTYYTTALITQKALAFIYFSLIARFMGVEDTGKYTFALSFTTLFAIFIDLGLASVLVREIAKVKNKSQEYLANILALKIPLSIVTYLIVAAAINILGYPTITKHLVYLSGVIMFLDSFATTFWAVMRGRQKLKYESIGVVGLQLITVGSGVAVLYYQLGIKFLMAALLLGSLFNLIYAIVAIKKHLRISITPRYEAKVLKMLFRIGLPFALAGIFNRIYTSLDTVLLSTLAGDAAVGWYSIPTKITGALQFLPLAFMAALFPAMSDYFVTDKEKLRRTFEKAMHYLMIISMPVATGIIVLASQAITQIYTVEYFNSILPLKILMVSLFFLFINFPVGYLLNACNKQVTNTINMAVTVLISVVLNVILIPRFSYVGAAVTALISTIILFLLGMYWVPKIIDYNRKYLVINFLKILSASLLMAYCLYYLLHEFNWFILVPIGALIYFAALWLIKGINKEDVIEAWHSLVKK